MTNGGQNLTFRARIRKRILSILEFGDMSFLEILARSLNSDPLEISGALHELMCADKVDEITTSQGLQRFRLTSAEKTGARHAVTQNAPNNQHHILDDRMVGVINEVTEDILRGISHPSPVFSQWWFSSRSCTNLISLLCGLDRSRGATAFLGSGVLGAVFSQVLRRSTTILDVDSVLLGQLQAFAGHSANLVLYDALLDVPDGMKKKHSLVVVDPPWGRTLLPIFLERGAALLALGGTLVMSFPQELTRPSIAREKIALLSLAQHLGLSLTRVLPNLTEYLVPPFEEQAYLKSGIHLSKPWRRGDIYVFQKAGTGCTECHFQDTPTKWEQFCAGRSRLLLKRDGRHENGRPVVAFLPGTIDNIGPTTSSRTTHWKTASLVSTHNAFFRVEGRKDFGRLLQETMNRPDAFSELLTPSGFRETEVYAD